MGGEPSLNDYFECFEKFQDYINMNNNQFYHGKNHGGYFVKYNDYNDLNKYINGIKEKIEREISSKTEEEILEDIKKKKLQILRLNNVIPQISKNDNDQQFLIINNDLYEKICQHNYEDNNNKFNYKIIDNELTIKYGDIKYKFLNQRNNIIEGRLYQGVVDANRLNNSTIVLNDSSKQFDQILKDNQNYYDNEMNVINNLNTIEEGTKILYTGYLVDKDWVDKWKKYSFYEKFKDNYLKKKNKEEIHIKNYMPNIQTNYDVGKNNIENSILRFPMNSEQIKEKLTNKQYVLLNQTFLSSFINTNEIKPSNNIYLSKNKLLVESLDNKSLSFPTSNNIISFENTSPNNNNNINVLQKPVETSQILPQSIYNSEYLRHLIRYPLFKNELLSDTSQKLDSSIAYLVNKEVINKIKNLYNLKEIFNFIENEGLLKEISYKNFDMNYPKICDYLNKNRSDYINRIKQLEAKPIEFQRNETFLPPKLLQNNNIMYFEGFELIDREFARFLLKINNNNLVLFEAFYKIIRQNQILIIINWNGVKYIYQTVSINCDGGDIITDLLIEIYPESSKETNIIINNIYSILLYNNNQSLNTGQFIRIQNNILIRFHKLNNLTNIINPIQNISTVNNINGTSSLINGITTQSLMENPYLKTDNNVSSNKDINNKNNTIIQNQKDVLMNALNSNPSIKQYYLINSNLLNLIKQKLNFIKSNAFGTQVFSIPTKNINNCLETQILDLGNKKYKYPINFSLIDQNSLKHIPNYSSLTNFIEEIYFIQVNQGYIFISKSNNILNDNLIYVYLNKKIGQNQINEPFGFFEFKDNIDKIKNFVLLSKDTNLNNIIHNPNLFEKNINSHFHLINTTSSMINKFPQSNIKSHDLQQIQNKTIIQTTKPEQSNISKILENEQFWKIIYLYINELRIKLSLRNDNFDHEDNYYLIKKNLFADIKTKYNYEKLINPFKGKLSNNIPYQNDISPILHSLPQKDLNNLILNLKEIQIPKVDKTSYEIEFTSYINPNNQNESFFIFKDFELINKEFANSLLNNENSYHVLKCSFVGNNKIVFHYPNNKFNNKKYLCVISKVDENENMQNEYLLIYDNQSYITKHFNSIKYNINNFIQNVGFVNNSAPLVINQCIIIGIIIELSPVTPPPPIKDSVNDFPKKPLIGLDNIGATCYMNATLQCLSIIQKLVDYFKYNEHLKNIVANDINREKLCSAFKELIDELYPYYISNKYKLYISKNKISNSVISSKSSYAPRNFKNIISKMNPLFQGIQANDAKDLVNFLIMKLHEELNRVPPEANNNTGNILLDQRNQAQMLQIFSDNFRKTNRSIISDLFYAMNCNITQCTNCNTVSYNYQVYFFLIFPLEEVRKFKLMNNGGNNNNYLNNMVDIYDCFDYDKKISVMDGDNSMYCNYCKVTCPSSMCTLLTTGPEILIIILNRGQGIQFNVKINFHLELNLMNYIQLNNTGCNYELFGVITHIGTSDMGGHFIAYCKSYFQKDYNKWYRFNDSLVTPVNDFNKEVIQFAMPYLLFYKKKS